MSPLQLRAEAVSYRAGGPGGREILRSVDLSASAGRPLAVTGPSGSGKTTLLLVLAGLDEPTSGRVVLDGDGAEGGGRPEVAVVLQSLGLVPTLTAMENVTVPLQARRLPRSEIESRAGRALGDLGLAEVAGHLSQELSGGQRQRVAMARALALEAPVLLADEPTAELDGASRSVVLDLLAAQAGAGRVVVVATHDPEVAGACAESVRLVEGRVEPG